MCKYGTYKLIKVNYRNLERCIDACIANEILYLNKKDIITLGCCCGHGEYNAEVLVDGKSFEKMLNLGYFCLELLDTGAYKFQLKSGCKSINEITNWHEIHRNEKFFEGFAVQQGANTPCY